MKMNVLTTVNREVISENINREINIEIKQGISIVKNELNYKAAIFLSAKIGGHRNGIVNTVE
jgi:hypothetical protein